MEWRIRPDVRPLALVVSAGLVLVQVDQREGRAVILSDYAKGALSREVCREIVQAAHGSQTSEETKPMRS